MLIFLLAGLSLFGAPDSRPRITQVTHHDRPHFRIETRSATYLYDIAGGGLSSIVDPEGNDWVAFQPEPWDEYPASAASAYRGVPNLVFRGDDGGAGHPGHDRCESRVVGHNQIHTVSTSGNWAWTLTFYPDCVRFDIVDTDPDHPYWFLYEGPPGGSYQPGETYWATDLTDASPTLPDHYQGEPHKGQHRYMLFGTKNSPYSLFVYQDIPDEHIDHVSLLGNEEIGATNSPDGMVVAGLGRGEGAQPLMHGENTFLVGLLPYRISTGRGLDRSRRRIGKLARRRTR